MRRLLSTGFSSALATGDAGRAGQRRRAWCPLTLAILVLAAWFASGCSDTRARGSRIMLITLDTLRYDSFAGGSGRSSAMPATRARAERCAAFDRFFAATSSTQPTHAAMFTAQHPWQHGVARNGQRLAAELETVAERLRSAGYSTSAVVASFPVSRRFGFAQGFDQFQDDFSRVLKGAWGHGGAGPEGDRYYSLATRVTDRAIDALDRATAERQFFWIHYFDPHGPYGDSGGTPTVQPLDVVRRVVAGEADRESEIRRARALYDRDVAFLDGALERLFLRLDLDAERLETHVVLVSDHGESFGEDGSMAHGKRLTPSQIHVPLVICSPRVAPGIRREVAGSIDVAPTLLALAGLGGLPEQAPEARDLTRADHQPGRAYGMRRTFERPFNDLRLDGRVRVLQQNLFYIVDRDGSLYRGTSRELIDPPGSPHNSPGRRTAAELLSLFRSFEMELHRHSPDRSPDLEAKRALEALGYVP